MSINPFLSSPEYQFRQRQASADAQAEWIKHMQALQNSAMCTTTALSFGYVAKPFPRSERDRKKIWRRRLMRIESKIWDRRIIKAKEVAYRIGCVWAAIAVVAITIGLIGGLIHLVAG